MNMPIDPRDWPLPISFVTRERELTLLSDAVRRGDPIIQVTGSYGMGKTTLVNEFAARIYPAKIIRFSSSRSFELSDALDSIVADFADDSRPSLLIVDDADLLDPTDLVETLRELTLRRRSVSTVVITANRLPLPGILIALSELSRDEFSVYARSLFEGALDERSLQELYEATKGNPRITEVLRNRWAHGGVASHDLPSLLAPFERAGLVDVSGRPLTAESAASKKIIVDVAGINDEFLRRAADDPKFVFQISPRQFEELVAELLSRQGYKVELTAKTRDGGKDIYAARHDTIGSFLYIVECKRYAPDNPVGVEVVRALHGVADLERVTGSMIVTTSYFSAEARALQSRIQYQMSLKEYLDLRQWLTYTRPP